VYLLNLILTIYCSLGKGARLFTGILFTQLQVITETVKAAMWSMLREYLERERD
jgi:hypothetical protein